MFSNSYQSGFVSIFFSVGSNPLSLWDKQVKNGHIRRVIDDEIKSLVLEISGTNVATTYITCPIKPRASLGIKLPFFVMIIKNMNKYFTFEIQILDDKEMHRRFRVSNFQSTTKVRPFCTTMPIGLSPGWNQVQFNLADFTKRAYGTTYMETMRVQIHANTRIRRLYFTDTLYTEEDLPNEFKLFGPASTQKKKQIEAKVAKEQVGKDQAHPVTPKTIQDKAEEEMPPPPTPTDEEVIQRIDVAQEEKAPGIKEEIPEHEQAEMQEFGEDIKAADVEEEKGVAAEETTVVVEETVTHEDAVEGPIEVDVAGDAQAVEIAAEGEAVAEVPVEGIVEGTVERTVEGTGEATEIAEVQKTEAAEPSETPAAEEAVVQEVEEPAIATEEPLPTIEEAEVGVATATELQTTEEPTTTESPTEPENESPTVPENESPTEPEYESPTETENESPTETENESPE